LLEACDASYELSEFLSTSSTLSFNPCFDPLIFLIFLIWALPPNAFNPADVYSLDIANSPGKSNLFVYSTPAPDLGPTESTD